MIGCTSTPQQQSTGQAIDDGVVTAKVKAKLIEDPVTKAHQINVETFKGTVQLSGFVESNEARTRALELAKDVEGVKKVTDALEVRKSDQLIGLADTRTQRRVWTTRLCYVRVMSGLTSGLQAALTHPRFHSTFQYRRVYCAPCAVSNGPQRTS